MSFSGIEQRLRLLSAEKRSLLAQRLQQGTDTITDTTLVNGTRLTAFLTTEPDGLEAGSDQLRNHLGKLLPEHMIPASFRILDSMPLLPNGKVDLNALEQMPEEADDSAETWVEPRNETERLLAHIWCDVLNMDSVSIHDNFFELGGDSILSIHVISKVNQQGLSLSPNDLFNFPTIARLEARIRSVAAMNGPTDPSAHAAGETQGLRASRDLDQEADSHAGVGEPVRAPFVMLHVGNEIASLIQSHLGYDRPVYVMAADWRHADLERDTSVEQLAAKNLTELRSLQPGGPYFLGGYSMGAPIALEMAQCLHSAGEKVELLFLLDPPEPAIPGSSPDSRISNPGNKAGGTTWSRSGESSAGVRQVARISGLSIAAQPKNPIVFAKKLLRRYCLRPLRTFIRTQLNLPLKTSLAVLYRRCGRKIPRVLRKTYVGAVYTDAWRRYEFKPYAGDVVIFYSSGAAGDKRLWEGVTSGELTVEWFEAGHLEFYQNSELMNRWTKRLAQLLMSLQTTARAGGSDGTAA